MQNFGGTTTSSMVFLKKRPIITLNGPMKVKNDHRNKFSNLSNWKEEALKLPQKCHYQRIVARIPRSVFKKKKEEL